MKPFHEAIRLNGRSYRDCETVNLPESTDALLWLTCSASSKPGSRLSWTVDPATPALIVNESIAAKCNTRHDGIVTCEHTVTIATKELNNFVQLTCVIHYDDHRTALTSQRACVVIVPHGTFWLVIHMFIVTWFCFCGTMYNIQHLWTVFFSCQCWW